jgi:hypothetical protein
MLASTSDSFEWLALDPDGHCLALFDGGKFEESGEPFVW